MNHAGILAQQIHAKTGIPFVLTEHSSTYARKLIRNWQRPAMLQSAQQCSARIAVSKDFCRLLETEYGGLDWQYIPNSLSPAFIRPVDLANKPKNADFTFCSVAHLNYNKGFDILLPAFAEALKIHPDLKLKIGGTGLIASQLHNLAAELGLDIAAARVASTSDPELLEKYSAEFARLRAKKGVTLEQAREKVTDVSYFGTMMVHMGDADGMVSGAAHTTAHTIVPSFQIIKTAPGVSVVSSIFLMAMKDRVWAFGDCAVNPNPTPEQLADIAVTSARTAAQFGVTPRVAMLSYSTGTSGSGPDVDAVVEATRLAREKAPELAIEGPIQFDAAVDAAVASKKLPGSDVAGKATVFVFPSLEAGNIGYKAVQRSSGAVAVGPVLQGLNKPVNDLSRGALVEDIVNTVALTAVQAQG